VNDERKEDKKTYQNKAEIKVIHANLYLIYITYTYRPPTFVRFIIRSSWNIDIAQEI